MSVQERDVLAFVDGVTNPDFEKPGGIPLNDSWGTHGSSFTRYCERSAASAAMREKIISGMATFSTCAALDIAGGSNGDALKELLSVGVIDKGLVTNYLDKREDDTRAIANLDHVDGDILSRDSWHDIEKWQTKEAPEGFGLVLHSPARALQSLTPVFFYQGAVHWLLDRTRSGGILFSKIPEALSNSDACEDVHDSILERGDCEIKIPGSARYGFALITKFG
jgi:hypothetical protein